ncbi:MAG TPA: glycosyltransferase family 39 protein [Terriglobales bacterium]
MSDGESSRRELATGHGPLATGFRIPDWILLLAFCAFFFFWRLAAFGLLGADEPRYAQVAREMLERHDWITPTLGGTPWLEKPPLYYWQARIAYQVFGVSDWAARLPSALDASLLVFAAYWFLRRLRGSGLDGALMLACCAGVVGFARAASTDMPLAAMFSIAMMAWFAWFENNRRMYLLLFYAFVALGTLAKGPVALLLAVLMVVIFAAVKRTPKVVLRSISFPGLAVFCAIALPWYVFVQIRNPEFFRVFIVQHNLARFGTNVFHHPEPLWYYLPVTLLGWVPWAVLAVLALAAALRRMRKDESDPLDAFLAIWIVLVIVFFSSSESKLPGYILPALPAGILLLANYWRTRAKIREHWAAMALHGMVSGTLLFAAFLLPAAVVRRHPAWDRSDILPLIVAVAIAAGVSRATRRTLRVATAVPAVLALAVALRLGAPALNTTLSARAVSDALSRIAPRPLPVADVLVSRETEYGLEFYRNQKMPEDELRHPLAGEHLIVAGQGTEGAMAKGLGGRKFIYLGSFPAQKLEFFYVAP